MKKRFTDKDLINQPHYTNILYLLMWAKHNNKKIKFKHLKYAFVKNHGNIKIIDAKEKEMKRFFDFKKNPELLEMFKGKKISTSSNLNTTYLSNLKRETLIELKEKCYYPTYKASFFVNKYLCHEYIDLFFDETFKRYKGKFTAGVWKASSRLEKKVKECVYADLIFGK